MPFCEKKDFDLWGLGLGETGGYCVLGDNYPTGGPGGGACVGAGGSRVRVGGQRDVGGVGGAGGAGGDRESGV
jgi:hypothetical protein